MSKIHDWKDKPSPGSSEAQNEGCTCPVLDNNGGKGVCGAFWISAGCPLHDPKPPTKGDN